MSGPKRERWALAALLLLHVLLGVYYSLAVPIWEAHDEDGHYYFVRHLATERRLPTPADRSISPNDEMHQPPLYYLLVALPVSLVEVDEELQLEWNPYFHWSGAQGGYNRFIHQPAAESWPYRGTALALHVGRLVSVLLGGLGLLFTFLAARTLCPSQPIVRWGALLVLAFWPQYRFTSAVLNNDLMVTVAAAAVTWLLARVLVAPQTRGRDLVALGVAAGLAPLSKNNGLAVVPVTLLALIAGLIRAKPRLRRQAALGLAGGLTAGAVTAGWWYAHNLARGGGMFGANRSAAWIGHLVRSILSLDGQIRWEVAGPALHQGLFSLWAGFGWNNVGLPLPLYSLAAAWATLGLLGLIVWLLRRPARAQRVGAAALALLILSVLGTGLLYYIRNAKVDLAGRYLLPAMPAASVLLAVGWTTLLPRRLRPAGWALMGGALGLLALLTPDLYIRPRYAAPQPPTEAEAATYTPVHARFGEFAELVAYRLEPSFVDPEGTLRLSLSWRTLATADADYSLAIDVFDDTHQSLGAAHRFPGRGALTTTTWEPGQLFVEEVAIPIHSAAAHGSVAWVEVSYYERHSRRAASVYDLGGHPLGGSLRLCPVKVRGREQAHPDRLAGGLLFGPDISLAGGRADVQAFRALPWVDLGLTWLAAGRPAGDYTVSLQLRDEEQAIIVQVDRQPREATYPTTFWEPGEAVCDPYTLFLPASLADGHYTLYACLYELASGERLPVLTPAGEPLPNNEAPLLAMIVEGGLVRQVQGRSPGLQIQAQYDRSPEQQTVQYDRAEAAIAAGLAEADRLLAAGQPLAAARALRAQVLPLDPASLPALYRLQQTRESAAGQARPEPAPPAVDRLRHFALRSVMPPRDPRLAVYLAEAMAALTAEGTWTRQTLLEVVSFQVWQAGLSDQSALVEPVLRSLLASRPEDQDLWFYLAENHQRQGHAEEAASLYRQVLDRDPEYAAACLRLGLLAEAEGSWAEAAGWYERYRQRAPEDLLGLARLAAAYEAIDEPEAAALQGLLRTRTDGRQLAASLLELPAQSIRLGPNLVENGGFEEWAGRERPLGWVWSPMFGRRPWNRAAFAGGADPLAPYQGGCAARVDGLWLQRERDRERARAGFWQAQEETGALRPIAVTADAPYLVTFAYRTTGEEARPTIWVSSDRSVFFAHDRVLPTTGGAWKRFAAVAWNRAGAEAAVQPLLRSFGAGTVEFDDLQIRPLLLPGELGLEPDELRFLVADGEG